MSLSSRPDTAFIRSCLLLPPGLWTRGRLAFEQEAVRVSSNFSSIGSARDGMWTLISGSRREMSFQGLLEC